MQVVRYGERVVDPEWGAGRVTEIVPPGRRGLEGGALAEALVAFDDGVTRAVCLDDLVPEQSESGLKA